MFLINLLMCSLSAASHSEIDVSGESNGMRYDCRLLGVNVVLVLTDSNSPFSSIFLIALLRLVNSFARCFW